MMKHFFTDRKGRRRFIGGNKFGYPVEKGKVRFESRRLSLYHNGKMENAVDIAVPVGSKVLAAREGIVEDVGTDSDGNRYVDIEHEGGLFTDYGHLSEPLVRKGQRVEQGEVIALSGDSGDLSVLPPHLHFEVAWEDDNSVRFEWIDPLPVVAEKIEVKYSKGEFNSAAKKSRRWRK
jgi:murein DD-endopeptidase MepM/ murein hydrolase activator NlpD